MDMFTFCVAIVLLISTAVIYATKAAASVVDLVDKVHRMLKRRRLRKKESRD